MFPVPSDRPPSADSLGLTPQKPNPSNMDASSYRLRPSGEPVSTFYDRGIRKPAVSLKTEWDDDRVEGSGPTRCDEPIMRRRHDARFSTSTLAAQRIGGVSMWRIPDLPCVPGGFTPCRIGKDLCCEDVA